MILLGTVFQDSIDIIPMQMLAFGVLIMAAHLGGRLFDRLHLSEPSGQLLGGVLVGPCLLYVSGLIDFSHSLYFSAISAFSFFVFVFIAVISFSLGEELHVDRLRKVGRSVLVISLTQSVITMVLISAGLYIFAKRPIVESMMIGSIGIASAPAMVFSQLNKMNVEGRLRNLLGTIEVLCDIVGVVVFSLLLQVYQWI